MEKVALTPEARNGTKLIAFLLIDKDTGRVEYHETPAERKTEINAFGYHVIFGEPEKLRRLYEKLLKNPSRTEQYLYKQ